jgi:hypothetical protein
MGQIEESVSIFEACEKSAACTCRRKTKLVSRQNKHFEQSRIFWTTQKHFEDFFFETFVLLSREHYILIMFFFISTTKLFINFLA